ncbi:ATP-binding protein [Nocardia higoensis]|nr:ATP-binding protein [Nocardia higoensis]
MDMGDRAWRQPTTAATTIGVRVPARPEQLTMLRALAETVGHIADFAIDEVADIRLALDEVATALVLDAVPGSELDCELDYGQDRMTVRVRGLTASKDPVARNGFGWHIVRTLTESVETAQEPYDFQAGGYRTSIDFDWSRSYSPPRLV